MIFKLITSLIVVLIAVNIFRNYRNHKISMTLFVLLNSCFIIILIITNFNQTADYIATFLGVGRGLDAILALSLVFTLYIVLSLYLKIKDLERNIVKIVQNEALQNKK